MQTQEDNMAEIATMRDGIATRIKDLSQRWAENTIDLGREFLRARDTFPANASGQRPGWHEWISKNTNWTHRHATSFVRIAEKSKSWKISSTTLTQEVLDFLARPDTPDAGALDVIDRAKKGEAVTLDKAKELIKPHLLTPAQAMKEARETGKLIRANDGHIYSGATEDEMLAHSQRRHVIYKMKDNITEIAECPLTPHQWIKSIGDNDHWVSEFKLRNIDVAIKFLTALRPLLEKRQEKIDGA